MPHATTSDGVNLYYEETGSGTPILFVHEYSGDYRSWEPQMRYFCRRYRCIAFNARGYPPSDVPDDVEMYSQQRAVEDAKELLDHLEIDKAHIVGLSMGGYTTMQFGVLCPERALSIMIGGVGFGAEPDQAEKFRSELEQVAQRWEQEGAKKFAPVWGMTPGREQLEAKDPRAYKQFIEQLSEHSERGAANTLRGVQMLRPSPLEMEAELSAMTVPALITHGDEDRPALATGAFLKRTIPSAGLFVLPKTGHTVNIEEPALFNQVLQEFFSTVENGRWRLRDKRTETPITLLGPSPEDLTDSPADKTMTT
ncbi:MAG: alpha/beta hydrolase [Alphaproteobacteria bacterium]|nr:alpha/beta hydrolase [Alphaproteobacteria bacterium]